MPEALIRRADAGDAAALAAIGVETFVETFGQLYPPADLAAYLAQAYDLARTRADLADPAKASWLAEIDGRAVGYATVGPCELPHPEVTPSCGELKRIYVAGAWQGSGLAARLYAEAVGWLERDGPRAICLGVWSENIKAQRFYARKGFVRVGEYHFHVGATVDDEFILRRDLGVSSSLAVDSASTEHNPA
jgi:GNAT superfamily N-acetyltransferase